MHDTHSLDPTECRPHCVLTLLGIRQVWDGYFQGTDGAPSVGWGRLHAGWYVDMSSGWCVEMSSSLHTTHSSCLHTTQHAVCSSQQMVLHLLLDRIHPILAWYLHVRGVNNTQGSAAMLAQDMLFGMLTHASSQDSPLRTCKSSTAFTVKAAPEAILSCSSEIRKISQPADSEPCFCLTAQATTCTWPACIVYMQLSFCNSAGGT